MTLCVVLVSFILLVSSLLTLTLINESNSLRYPTSLSLFVLAIFVHVKSQLCKSRQKRDEEEEDDNRIEDPLKKGVTDVCIKIPAAYIAGPSTVFTIERIRTVSYVEKRLRPGGGLELDESRWKRTKLGAKPTEEDITEEVEISDDDDGDEVIEDEAAQVEAEDFDVGIYCVFRGEEEIKKGEEEETGNLEKDGERRNDSKKVSSPSDNVSWPLWNFIVLYWRNAKR